MVDEVGAKGVAGEEQGDLLLGVIFKERAQHIEQIGDQGEHRLGPQTFAVARGPAWKNRAQHANAPGLAEVDELVFAGLAPNHFGRENCGIAASRMEAYQRRFSVSDARQGLLGKPFREFGRCEIGRKGLCSPASISFLISAFFTHRRQDVRHPLAYRHVLREPELAQCVREVIGKRKYKCKRTSSGSVLTNRKYTKLIPAADSSMAR